MNKDRHRLSATAPIPPGMLSGLLRALRPEKIICFGIRANAAEAWSCLLDLEAKSDATYDLLILTASDEKRPQHQLLDMAAALNTKSVRMNALIHNVASVMKAINNGQPFFTKVCTQGHVWYDTENPSFKLAPMDAHSDEFRLITNDSHWANGFGRAQQFFSGASHFLGRGWYALSSFMLHQAMEHTCIALTQAITGYRPNTHSLNRLTRMIDNFAPISQSIFPCNTREEVHLFDILSRAYSEARYNVDYWITAREISILIERVSDFQSRAENVYKKVRRKQCQCSNN